MPAAQLRRRFIASYTIALLAIALSTGIAHFATIYTVNSESRSAEVVNMSGKQRMLLQRSLALVELTAGDRSDARHVQMLQSTMDELLAANEELYAYAQHGVLSEELRDDLIGVFSDPMDGITVLLGEYEQLVHAALAGTITIEQRARFEDLTFGVLFTRIHYSVGLFQSDAEFGLERINQIQILHFALIIAVLIAEALFIFAPLLSRMAKALTAEQEARSAAQEALKIQAEALSTRSRFVSAMSEYFLNPLRRAVATLEQASEVDREVMPGMVKKALVDLRDVDMRGREIANAYRKDDSDSVHDDLSWKESDLAKAV